MVKTLSGWFSIRNTFAKVRQIGSKRISSQKRTLQLVTVSVNCFLKNQSRDNRRMAQHQLPFGRALKRPFRRLPAT